LKVSRHTLFIVVILSCSIIYGCNSENTDGTVLTGTVTKVYDGDSIHITPDGKKRVVIRLAAIDAPEVKQSHGIQSRDFLRRIIMNKQVTARCNKLDKYKRHVCVVLHNGQDTNLLMVESGQAWYFERFKDEQTHQQQRLYRKAATNAKNQKLGLWQNTSVIPPWEFRASNSN